MQNYILTIKDVLEAQMAVPGRNPCHTPSAAFRWTNPDCRVSRLAWRWPSWYEGPEDGSLNPSRLSEVFARFLPQAYHEQGLLLGIDVSGIARPRARTSADRSAQHVHHLPECKKPVTYGWQFSAVVALPQTPSSWVYTLGEQLSAL